MMIRIPTTVFALKMVFSLHKIPYTPKTKTTPIELRDGDEFIDLLRFNGSSKKQEPEAWLSVSISPNIAKHIGKDVFSIGQYIDRFYKRMLAQYVQARSHSKTEKQQAIRDFLHLHHIDEDDYSEEAAIKRVQRYLEEKKTAKSVMISDANVGKTLHFSHKHHYTDSELHHIYMHYRNLYPYYFVTAKKTERIKLPKQIQMWIHATIGDRAQMQIAKTFKTTTVSVWRNIQSFESEFQHRPKPVPYVLIP